MKKAKMTSKQLDELRKSKVGQYVTVYNLNTREFDIVKILTPFTRSRHDGTTYHVCFVSLYGTLNRLAIDHEAGSAYIGGTWQSLYNENKLVDLLHEFNLKSFLRYPDLPRRPFLYKGGLYVAHDTDCGYAVIAPYKDKGDRSQTIHYRNMLKLVKETTKERLEKYKEGLK